MIQTDNLVHVKSVTWRQRSLAAKLDEAVKAVAPISGVSIGRRDDRSTWKAHFNDNATPEQIEAAQAVIDGFVEVDDPTPPDRIRELEDTVALLIAERHTVASGTSALEDSPDGLRVETRETSQPEETPLPLPPNPEEAKLSDYGEVGEPGDEVENLRGLMKSDPSGFAERVKGLSTARRKILTDSFRQRMNELNNERLRGVRLNPVDAEWLEDHQTLYHLLAESGDA